MIRRIRIQNFKSLRDVTVDLSPVTVLVGKSGTGKTNFAQALGFLRDLVAGRDKEYAQQSLQLSCATSNSGDISIDVDFSIPNYDAEFHYGLTVDPKFLSAHPSAPVVDEVFSCGDRMVFRQSRKNPKNQTVDWDEPPKLVSPPPPGPIAINRLPGLGEVVDAYTAISTGIGIYSFPYDVLTHAKRTQTNGSTGFEDDGDNFLAAMKDIATDLKSMVSRRVIAATLRKVNETVDSIDLDSVQSPKKAIVGHKFGEKTLALDLSQESDGFRRFYAHLLALYQTQFKLTLVFEEPENGIYPGALGLLAEEFKAAPGAGRGQVILTTHSPALLDHFEADQIRVVELIDLETKIGPLAEEQRSQITEDLLVPGELLTVVDARGEGTPE